MKTIFTIACATLFCLPSVNAQTAQTPKAPAKPAQKTEVLSKFIKYSVSINEADGQIVAEADLANENIHRPDRIDFVQSLLDDVLSMKVAAYSDRGILYGAEGSSIKPVKLSAEELNERLKPVVKRIMVDNKTMERAEVETTEPIGPERIAAIYYVEAWTYDNTSKMIDKEVIAYGPMIKRYSEDEVFLGKQVLFFVLNEPVAKKYIKVLK